MAIIKKKKKLQAGQRKQKQKTSEVKIACWNKNMYFLKYGNKLFIAIISSTFGMFL